MNYFLRLTKLDIEFLHNISHCLCYIPALDHNVREVVPLDRTSQVELLEQVLHLPFVIFLSFCHLYAIKVQPDS